MEGFGYTGWWFHPAVDDRKERSAVLKSILIFYY